MEAVVVGALGGGVVEAPLQPTVANVRTMLETNRKRRADMVQQGHSRTVPTWYGHCALEQEPLCNAGNDDE